MYATRILLVLMREVQPVWFPWFCQVPIIQHPPQAQQQMVAPRPVLPQGVGQVPRASQDPIRAFLQQNPTIVMKPPSPAPVGALPAMMAGHPAAQGPVPSPLPPGLPPPSIRVSQGNNPATARVPSPLSESASWLSVVACSFSWSVLLRLSLYCCLTDN